jgi:hypothetical protein
MRPIEEGSSQLANDSECALLRETEGLLGSEQVGDERKHAHEREDAWEITAECPRDNMEFGCGFAMFEAAQSPTSSPCSQRGRKEGGERGGGWREGRDGG